MKYNRSISVEMKDVTKSYSFGKSRSINNLFNLFYQQGIRNKILDRFSLKIMKGECVLISGSNGAGKTTILKLISGIILPDSGVITVKGRIVPLIEMGAGFNIEFTGMENIWVNGCILGMEKREIRSVLPKIIEFSGLKNYMDIPLKKYSRGMVARLAFSIAINTNPDILLLDEVFSVGDEEFRGKSFTLMNRLKKNGVIIVLCTHNQPNIPLVDRIISLPNRNINGVIG